jgi:hypothetical protein
VFGEELAESVVEGCRGLARHDVVRWDRAALFYDLAGRLETDDPVKARTVEVSLGDGDVSLEWCAGLCIRFDDGHGFTLLVEPGSR